MKVGADLDDDSGRAALLRSELGPDRLLMTDANQRWDVGQAIEWMRALEAHDPYWIEEPTSPDDVLGHAAIARALAPMKVATGEHAHNRVMFKQLLQADAISVCQVDACRLGGVNEVLAVSADGRQRRSPRCARTREASGCASTCRTSRRSTTSRCRAHSTGACASGPITCTSTSSGRSRWRGGRYRLPDAPGYGVTMRPDSLERFRFPDGPVWRRAARKRPSEARLSQRAAADAPQPRVNP